MNAGAASKKMTRLSLETVNGINPRRRHIAVPSKICQYPRIRTQVGLYRIPGYSRFCGTRRKSHLYITNLLANCRNGSEDESKDFKGYKKLTQCVRWPGSHSCLWLIFSQTFIILLRRHSAFTFKILGTWHKNGLEVVLLADLGYQIVCQIFVLF
jgi:hypothetical protein